MWIDSNQKRLEANWQALFRAISKQDVTYGISRGPLALNGK